MGRLSRNQSGFSGIEMLLILITLGIIGTVGFFVAKHVNKKPVTTPITSTTTSTTTTPTTTTPKPVDPYSGWTTYCDNNANACFKYPSTWKFKTDTNNNSVVALILQNQKDTVEVSYKNTYVDSNTTVGDFYVSSIDSLKTTNTKLKAVGGYYLQTNTPNYYLADTSLIQTKHFNVGQNSQLNNSPGPIPFTNTDATSKGELSAYNTVPPKVGNSVNEANSWFMGNDAKTALLIVESFYNK